MSAGVCSTLRAELYGMPSVFWGKQKKRMCAQRPPCSAAGPCLTTTSADGVHGESAGNVLSLAFTSAWVVWLSELERFCVEMVGDVCDQRGWKWRCWWPTALFRSRAALSWTPLDPRGEVFPKYCNQKMLTFVPYLRVGKPPFEQFALIFGPFLQICHRASILQAA